MPTSAHRRQQDHRATIDGVLLDEEPRQRERQGRWMMIAGVVLAAAGCLVWVYVILRERGVAEDSRDLVPGISAPVVGFCAILVGLALASVGSARSRDR